MNLGPFGDDPFFGNDDPFPSLFGRGPLARRSSGRDGDRTIDGRGLSLFDRMMRDFPMMGPDSMPSGGFEECPPRNPFPSSGSGYTTHTSSFTSYSSSSGPDGRFYSKSVSESHGPGGVSERHVTERDSAAELERMAVSRMLGDRTRTVTKERKRGEESTVDTLHNIGADEGEDFDQKWTGAASRALPSGGAAAVNNGQGWPGRLMGVPSSHWGNAGGGGMPRQLPASNMGGGAEEQRQRVDPIEFEELDNQSITQQEPRRSDWSERRSSRRRHSSSNSSSNSGSNSSRHHRSSRHEGNSAL